MSEMQRKNFKSLDEKFLKFRDVYGRLNLKFERFRGFLIKKHSALKLLSELTSHAQRKKLRQKRR